MAGGEANFGIGMEHTRCGEPVLHQAVDAGPVGPAFPAAAEKYSPPESCHPVAKYIKAFHIARHRSANSARTALWQRTTDFVFNHLVGSARVLVSHKRPGTHLDAPLPECHRQGPNYTLTYCVIFVNENVEVCPCKRQAVSKLNRGGAE